MSILCIFLNGFKNRLGGGSIYPEINSENIEKLIKIRKVAEFTVSSKTLLNYIFKIFDKCPLWTQKKLDYQDFKKIFYFKIINDTISQQNIFQSIIKIKNNINSKRIHKSIREDADFKLAYIYQYNVNIMLELYAMKVARTVLWDN